MHKFKLVSNSRLPPTNWQHLRFGQSFFLAFLVVNSTWPCVAVNGFVFLWGSRNLLNLVESRYLPIPQMVIVKVAMVPLCYCAIVLS